MKQATRILIVDDDPDCLSVFSELLRHQGYEVWAASTGEEGWQATRDRRPDVVLLDVRLPDLSGMELCRQIKADPALIDVFVVLFSGQAASPAAQVEGRETGADDFLDKLLPPEEFEARLRTMVRLRHAAAALRASERHYRQLIEILPDAVVVVDLAGRITAVNPQAVGMLGYARAEELLDKSILDLVPAEDRGRTQSDLAGAAAVVRMAERTLLRKRGDCIQVELSAAAMPDVQGQTSGFVFVARDITDRKQLEREVIDISANERRRIGHELHDGVGQYLAGIAFRAKALEQTLAAAAAPQADAARELVSLLGLASGQVRRLAHGLSPIGVEGRGVVAALQHLAADTLHLFGVLCQVHCADSDLLIPPSIGLELYRIVQEAIHNAIDHGQARRIDIEMALDTTHLRLGIRDDGIGFQAERKSRPGIGVRLMEYRAHAIGGTLTINSQPDQGTEICCLVPRVLCFPTAGRGDG